MTAVVTAALVLLGLGVYQTAPPSVERVDRVANALPIPANADLLWDEQTPSDWCVDGCSNVERYYAVPDAQEARREFDSALSAEGWRPVSARWCRGSYSVSAVPLPPDWPGFVDDPRPPTGEEAVSVLTTANC